MEARSFGGSGGTMLLAEEGQDAVLLGTGTTLLRLATGERGSPSLAVSVKEEQQLWVCW